jgi:hypothetical protein
MADLTHKICTNCNEQKLLIEFYKDSRVKDGYVSKCKECSNTHRRNVYDSNKESKRGKDNYRPEKKHEYYMRIIKPKLQNNDEYKEFVRKKRHEYCIRVKEKKHEHYIRVIKPKLQNDIKYRESVRERQRTYVRNRYYNDSNFRLRHNLGKRISQAIQSKNKAYDTLTLLGVENINKVRQHLEKQFTNNMSWNKSGSFVIDHIIPISIFDLTNPIQQKVACHYTNLQPLTREDNARKATKVPDGFNLNEYINTKRLELNI